MENVKGSSPHWPCCETGTQAIRAVLSGGLLSRPKVSGFAPRDTSYAKVAVEQEELEALQANKQMRKLPNHLSLPSVGPP